MTQQDPRSAPSIYTRGAVDLGSYRSTPEPAEPPPSQQPASDFGAGQPADGGGVSFDVTEATFQTEVLERSLNTPVVVDFWAEWCGPCKQLSPLLERLAAEADGQWVLAKVDVDSNQRLAAAFRVQSIPTVYAVVGGQPVDGFAGVIPETQLRQWLDAILKAAGVETPEPETDGRIIDADDYVAAGDLDEAEALYREVLAERPAEELALSGLAQVELLRRVQHVDSQRVLADAQARPDDVAAQTLAADCEVMAGAAEEAYARLVGLIRRSFGNDREAARAHLLSLFSVAGPDDPAVARARRDLASALF